MRTIFQDHASDLFGIRLFLIIIIPREGQNHRRSLSSQWSASQVSLLRATLVNASGENADAEAITMMPLP